MVSSRTSRSNLKGRRTGKPPKSTPMSPFYVILFLIALIAPTMVRAAEGSPHSPWPNARDSPPLLVRALSAGAYRPDRAVAVEQQGADDGLLHTIAPLIDRLDLCLRLRSCLLKNGSRVRRRRRVRAGLRMPVMRRHPRAGLRLRRCTVRALEKIAAARAELRVR